ncbi:MAG: thiamine ABC transporter substrate-binding protein [Anaerolineales bacterium]|nr:thiamine ABC transporter substrate-binding protein [Anaerolineales bacterium]MBK8821560.1 thiamine ABC transporter substrate-binding protein [Anaerolineales bacterium]
MKHITFYFLLFTLLLASCAPKPAEPRAITVLTHDSFAISEDVVKAFESENNAKVSFIQSGDAGSMLNQAILTKDAPIADVIFGVDNTFLSRALEADIFEAYQSPALTDIPDEFKLDPSNRALPVDYGDVCINYDKVYFAENNLALPQSFEDLAKPEYKDLLVVENPATSSPGLAFLLATRAHFGDGYLDYWKSLKDNGVVVVDGWETAYYTNFSASSGKGPQPMVVSYASSPAAEVFFASPAPTEAPTASIVASDMCFRQIEFVGILKNGQNNDIAQKFVDFMLSQQFQEDMPLNMFVYPVNKNAKLPEVFVKYAQVAESPAVLSYSEIASNRDAWIEAWTEAMK